MKLVISYDLEGDPKQLSNQNFSFLSRVPIEIKHFMKRRAGC